MAPDLIEPLLRFFLPLALQVQALMITFGVIAPPAPPAPPPSVTATAEVFGFHMPPSVQLPIPYTVQAPFANWNIHEESCEEAALLMAHQYVTSMNEQAPAWYDARLREMKLQQRNAWGEERDLTITEMDALWDLSFSRPGPTLRERADVSSLRWHLAHQRVVILPVMSHQLRNPHYGPKSVYHMVTLIGYEGDSFIVHDPGIKQGRAWVYPTSVIMEAWAAGVRARPQLTEALIIGLPGDIIQPYLHSAMIESPQS